MTRRTWTRLAGVNLVFAAFHPQLGLAWPGVATSLAINAVLFLLPAAGWSAVAWHGSRALGMRLLRALAISTGAFFAALLVMRVTGQTPTRALAWNVLWLLTNLGFAAAALAGRSEAARRSLTRLEMALGGAIFFSCYIVYYAAAILTPPQADHDLEVQGTGYGLITRFEPLLLTDRGTAYYFAHPPLLHFYVGGSFLLYGTLSDLAPFDTASQRAREALQSTPDSAAPRGPAIADPADLKAIYDTFTSDPHKVETRTPNVFFASATVALLALWAGRLSRRWWLGALVAVAYASNPEVFVRSSYGGYFAIGGLFAALMLLAAEHWRRWPRRRAAGGSIAAGWLAGLSDHKLVLLPAALQLCRLLSRAIPAMSVRRERSGRGWRSLLSPHPVTIGFALGLTAFWCFGLFWAPAAFLRDHLHDHILDRITHENPLGYNTYPTPLGLWAEFASHTAFVVVPLGLLLLAVDTMRAPARRRRRDGFRGLWLVWTLLTAVAFTLVDWRMTKHLIPMLLPLHLGLTPTRAMPAWRTALSVAALSAVVAWNLVALISLTRNFGAFTVTPGW